MENTSYGGPGRYADIMLDRWFKRSFKEYGNANRLMLLFLQALIPERRIASLTYTPEESTNQNQDGKSVRVDVECTDENGQRFMVEVQRSEQHDFFDRAVFNSTFAIQRQLREGAERFAFKPVYFIGIMRFSLHPDDKRFPLKLIAIQRQQPPREYRVAALVYFGAPSPDAVWRSPTARPNRISRPFCCLPAQQKTGKQQP